MPKPPTWEGTPHHLAVVHQMSNQRVKFEVLEENLRGLLAPLPPPVDQESLCVTRRDTRVHWLTGGELFEADISITPVPERPLATVSAQTRSAALDAPGWTIEQDAEFAEPVDAWGAGFTTTWRFLLHGELFLSLEGRRDREGSRADERENFARLLAERLRPPNSDRNQT
jgi:hypothetical protein